MKEHQSLEPPWLVHSYSHLATPRVICLVFTSLQFHGPVHSLLRNTSWISNHGALNIEVNTKLDRQATSVENPEQSYHRRSLADKINLANRLNENCILCRGDSEPSVRVKPRCRGRKRERKRHERVRYNLHINITKAEWKRRRKGNTGVQENGGAAP